MDVDALLNEFRDRAKSPVSFPGGQRLSGDVAIQGAKNSALKILPATVVVGGRYVFHRFPIILDTLDQLHILEHLGCQVQVDGSTVTVDSREISNRAVPRSMTRSTTAAFYLLGALLARFGRARVGLPGGDEIGHRPVDMHVEGLRGLGAEVLVHGDSVEARFLSPPVSGSIEMVLPSAGATVNVILASIGRVEHLLISGGPYDADTRAFLEFLDFRFEASVSAGRVELRAHDYPMPDPVRLTMPPDRNDAVTWLAAGSLSEEGVKLHDVDPEDLLVAIDTWRAVFDCDVEIGKDSVFVRGAESRHKGRKRIVAGASPGFHSDWAPFAEVAATRTSKHVTVVDTLHSDRVRQAELLQEMGARVRIGGGDLAGVKPLFPTPTNEARYIVEIEGRARLHGITSPIGNDVRACAAICLAAVGAQGRSTLTSVNAIYRGYANFYERLDGLIVG